jgi:hypothetical protein
MAGRRDARGAAARVVDARVVDDGGAVEERVRVCRNCNAIVGWFALFCEACGTRQPPREAPPAAAAAGAVGPGATPPPETPAPKAQEAAAAPTADARTVARGLFQAQLGLMQRHRENVEALARDVEVVKKELAAAEGLRRDLARRALDGLSERMFDAEHRWGELQVSYNRESEAIEEETRESMEMADLDAYLSPDENAMVEAEYAALAGRFEHVDGLLRDVGRALALLRQGTQSAYLRAPGARSGPRVGLLVLTAGLVACSMYFALFQHRDAPAKVATTVGPLLAALCIWVVLAFWRRNPA